MSERKRGATQVLASAKAGISERSGRTIESNTGWKPAGQRPRRKHRTRANPFEAVWSTEVVPLLEATPGLDATTILAELQERHPGAYGDGQLRTLQRHIRHWRATTGPEQEVLFAQKVDPGWQALFDFTVADALGVTIGGEAFPHRLAHLRLRYSGLCHAEVVRGGESWTAVASALVHGFDAFGGVTQTLRTDSLAAAWKNLSASEAEDQTRAFNAFCETYRIEPTRNNRGVSHENGGIESPNGHLKHKLEQALLLRGSRDFETQADYEAFVGQTVAAINGRLHHAFQRERPHLGPLPKAQVPTYGVRSARVTGHATITVARCTYSVASRLIGHQLTVHLFDDRLECYCGTDLVRTLRRHHAPRGQRAYSIDFRDVIHSLIKKPGAFRSLSYRDALHPSDIFHRAWHDCDERLEKKQAPRAYLRILHLAHHHGVPAVEAWLSAQLTNGLPCCEKACEKALRESGQIAGQSPPAQEPFEPDAAVYDALLDSERKVA